MTDQTTTQHCHHSFPDPYPHDLTQPGPCRHCGTTYQDAKHQEQHVNPIRRLARALRRRQTTPRCDTCHHPTPALISDMTGPITDQPRRECPTCSRSTT